LFSCKSPQKKLDESWLVREIENHGQRASITIDVLAPVTLEVGVEGKKAMTCASRCTLDLGPGEIPAGHTKVAIVASDPNVPGVTSKRFADVDREGLPPELAIMTPSPSGIQSVQGKLEECGTASVAAGKTGVVVAVRAKPGSHVTLAKKTLTLDDGDEPSITQELTFGFADLYPLIAAGTDGVASLVIPATAKSLDDVTETQRVECPPLKIVGADFFSAKGRGITWPGDDAAPAQKSTFWGGGFSPARIVGPAKSFAEVTHLAVIDWQERESKSCGPYTNGLSSSSEYLFPTKYAHHVQLFERKTGKAVGDKWFGPPGVYLACPQSITVIDGKVNHPDYEPSRDDEEKWAAGVLASQ
jgi:hypothetical protein